MARTLAWFVALLMVVSCADTVKPNEVGINRKYSLRECMERNTAPPCNLFSTGAHEDTADSGYVAFALDHTASWKLGTTTRIDPCYLSLRRCVDTTVTVDSATGTYRIAGDSLIVTLTRGDTIAVLPFIAEIPPTVERSWLGPDSLTFNVNPAQTHWVRFKP